MKLVILRENALFIPRQKAVPEMCEAVEILCDFWNKKVIWYGKGKPPALLEFLVLENRMPRNYCICAYDGIDDIRIYKENAAVIIITDEHKLKTAENLIISKYGLLLPDNGEIILAVKEYGGYSFTTYRKEKL